MGKFAFALPQLLLGFLAPFVRFFVSHITKLIGQDDFGRCHHDFHPFFFEPGKTPVPWFQVLD